MPTIEWSTITEEFRGRGSATLRQRLLAVLPLDLAPVDELFVFDDPRRRAGPAGARATLRSAFERATAEPGGGLLLSLYVYLMCQNTWELTADWDFIRVPLGALAEVAEPFAEQVARRDEAEASLLRLTVQQARSIDACMLAENGLNCSCPVAMGQHAATVVERAGRVRAATAAPLPGSALDGVRAFLHASATTEQVYYSSLVAVAGAVLGLVEALAGDVGDVGAGRGAAVEAMRRVAAEVAEAERHDAVAGDVYASELRAHRLTLAALADGVDRPWIHVDEAKLIHCYPFVAWLHARDGDPATELIDRARAIGPGRALGRVAPLDVTDLGLTDLWLGSDPRGRGYRGVSVRLPDLHVVTTAGDRLGPFAAELRLSELGNHHLRIESRLRDTGLHEVNQALRRGSPLMGAEEIGCDGGSWSRFTEYVDEVLDGLGDLLHKAGGVQRRAGFHSVLSIRSASLVDPGGARRPASGHDLLTATGASLLLQPVHQAAVALEEWVRYPLPEVRNLIADRGFRGDVVVRTPNTTVLALQSTPNFLVLEYEEMAEFVATLPALLERWTAQIAERVAEDAQALDQLDTLLELLDANAGGDPAAGWHEERFRRLDRSNLQLRKLMVEARSLLALIHSPTICATLIHREFLDRLADAARLPLLEADLHAQIAEADALYQRLSTLGRELSARHQREVERRQAAAQKVEAEEREQLRGVTEAVLAVLTAASVAGVFSLINDHFRPATGWVLLELAVIGLIIVAVAVQVGRVIAAVRRRRRDQAS